jgi:aminoglycoside phosphotransferase (APT) family kinase protein
MAALEPAPVQAVSPSIVDALRRAGLCAAGENPRGEALGGGVSSDIWRVDLASGPVCVKRALPRLRVAQLWEAPVKRNHYERLWLETASRIVPGCAPSVLAYEEDFFVMDFLEPARHPVWKALLRDGHADPAFAAEVGRRLATVHAGTRGAQFAAAFATDAIFHAIRLEPYLLATAKRHPDLAASFQELAERTAATRECLVHGDVSPKNILAGPGGPVFLDAECAWYGDPAFDLAFCLNHLLLKCLWVPTARRGFLQCFDALAQGYLERITIEDVEARTASLLPALLLARVDGKSPVEYLTEPAQKETVRAIARALLRKPPSDLKELCKTWQESST